MTSDGSHIVLPSFFTKKKASSCYGRRLSGRSGLPFFVFSSLITVRRGRLACQHSEDAWWTYTVVGLNSLMNVGGRLEGREARSHKSGIVGGRSGFGFRHDSKGKRFQLSLFIHGNAMMASQAGQLKWWDWLLCSDVGKECCCRYELAQRSQVRSMQGCHSDFTWCLAANVHFQGQSQKPPSSDER